jgi:glc operon protein GlcG
MNKTVTGLLLLIIMHQAAAQETEARTQLTLAGAKKVAAIATAYAREHNAPGGAIAIVDEGGHLMYLERLDNTFPAGSDVSVGKARTAVMFRKPTRVFEDIVNKGRTSMVTVPAVTGFTPLQGGVPLERDGRIVGAIGVSGAASAQQDDDIAQAAANAFAAVPMLSDATYIESRRVKAAFKSGDALIDNPAYKVNASRRDSGGEAEVHLGDTDIFYVLNGSAEFVTGGEIVDAKNVAAGEVRGSAIRGGTTHSLQRGDVITIPQGLPHWFKSVKSPMTYYVVKSSTGTGG